MTIQQQNDILLSNFNLTQENKNLLVIIARYKKMEEKMYETLDYYCQFNCNNEFERMIECTKVELYRRGQKIIELEKELKQLKPKI